jgi:tetratricopeptide (TPR) repeat protein
VGVLAFLIGAGYFKDDAFVLRQYFLRDPVEEPATLEHLGDWSDNFDGLVSFNGRGFDVPILQNRFILSRLRPAILKAPHLDLLPPSRRVWRGRFESCRLGMLERRLLGVQRSQDDIMSWLIPDLYRQYLRGGDNGEMRQVLYHNAVDILSLVVLAERLCRLFADPFAEEVDPRERVALARWFQALGLADRAEMTYRAALGDLLPLEVQHICLRNLAALLKRRDRRAEAVPLWIQWAMEDEDNVEAHVELAKFYEWHQVELEKALAWTEQALAVVARWHHDPRQSDAEAELNHRLERLKRKIH